MTATGLALMAYGCVLLLAFGNARSDDLNTGEWIGGVCVLAGFMVFTAGVTVWLWKVMP